jgi:hypothetical protein
VYFIPFECFKATTSGFSHQHYAHCSSFNVQLIGGYSSLYQLQTSSHWCIFNKWSSLNQLIFPQPLPVAVYPMIAMGTNPQKMCTCSSAWSLCKWKVTTYKEREPIIFYSTKVYILLRKPPNDVSNSFMPN